MKINIDKVADLCGSTRRTVLKRCIDVPKIKGSGREQLMESTVCLPVMFGSGMPSDKKTLETERTRLASAQANKTELEVEVIRGNLIPADQVEEVVNNMISSFRAKMLSLPTKAAPTIVAMADTAQVEASLKEYVYEALQELSEYDSEKYSTQDDKQSGKAGSATTSTYSEPMGGQEKKTIKRGKRRTRPVEH